MEAWITLLSFAPHVLPQSWVKKLLPLYSEKAGAHIFKTGVPALSLKCAHLWKPMAYPKWVPDIHGVHQEFKQAPDGSWEESSRSLRDGWIEDGRADFRFCSFHLSFLFLLFSLIVSLLLNLTFSPLPLSVVSTRPSALTGGVLLMRISAMYSWNVKICFCMQWHTNCISCTNQNKWTCFGDVWQA